MGTNVGRWDSWYRGLKLDDPQSYGDVTTYHEAGSFLEDCATVEDWGTGKGFFKTLRPDAIGVDGSDTPFADVIADLTEYRSECDGLLLRHVLEHNREWAKILDNANASAKHKVCIVLFTPIATETKEIADAPDIGVPDISFNLWDILSHIAAESVTVYRLKTNTQYGEETIIQAVR